VPRNLSRWRLAVRLGVPVGHRSARPGAIGVKVAAVACGFLASQRDSREYRRAAFRGARPRRMVHGPRPGLTGHAPGLVTPRSRRCRQRTQRGTQRSAPRGYSLGFDSLRPSSPWRRKYLITAFFSRQRGARRFGLDGSTSKCTGVIAKWRRIASRGGSFPRIARRKALQHRGSTLVGTGTQ
jgi:hypothetical protein